MESNLAAMHNNFSQKTCITENKRNDLLAQMRRTFCDRSSSEPVTKSGEQNKNDNKHTKNCEMLELMVDVKEEPVSDDENDKNESEETILIGYENCLEERTMVMDSENCLKHSNSPLLSKNIIKKEDINLNTDKTETNQYSQEIKQETKYYDGQEVLTISDFDYMRTAKATEAPTDIIKAEELVVAWTDEQHEFVKTVRIHSPKLDPKKDERECKSAEQKRQFLNGDKIKYQNQNSKKRKIDETVKESHLNEERAFHKDAYDDSFEDVIVDVESSKPKLQKIEHPTRKFELDTYGDTNKDVVVPEGWRREVVIRKGGLSSGLFDVYYFSPKGKKLRSRIEVERYCQEQGIKVDLNLFKFNHGGGHKVTRPPSIPKIPKTPKTPKTTRNGETPKENTGCPKGSTKAKKEDGKDSISTVKEVKSPGKQGHSKGSTDVYNSPSCSPLSKNGITDLSMVTFNMSIEILGDNVPNMEKHYEQEKEQYLIPLDEDCEETEQDPLSINTEYSNSEDDMLVGEDNQNSEKSGSDANEDNGNGSPLSPLLDFQIDKYLKTWQILYPEIEIQELRNIYQENKGKVHEAMVKMRQVNKQRKMMTNRRRTRTKFYFPKNDTSTKYIDGYMWESAAEDNILTSKKIEEANQNSEKSESDINDNGDDSLFHDAKIEKYLKMWKVLYPEVDIQEQRNIYQENEGCVRQTMDKMRQLNEERKIKGERRKSGSIGRLGIWTDGQMPFGPLL